MAAFGRRADAPFVFQRRDKHPYNDILESVFCPSHPLWMGPHFGNKRLDSVEARNA